MNQYLVKKADGLELITQKHVLNYISRLNCSDDPVASNLQGERSHCEPENDHPRRDGEDGDGGDSFCAS